MSDMFQERSDLDFVSDVLIDALQQKRTNLISGLFDLYNSVRESESTSGVDSGFDFKLTSDYLNDVVAAGSVNIPGAASEDVISFGDYKSQEYRPE